VLNFDPHRWIAERGPPAPLRSVATVATVASDVSDIEKSDSGERPATTATTATLRGWHECIGRLDPCQPLEGFPMGRWQTLYDDAVWLLDNFGKLAARDGWSAADLFGLWPDKPYWGGIADRLRGARSLVMDAERASWRSWGQVERFNRGAYPDLPPLWRDQAPNPKEEVLP
jgi:hypothetical protein